MRLINNVIRIQILSYFTTILLIVGSYHIYGCASGGGLKPETVAQVGSYITTAQVLLHSLDTFYDDLVLLKMVPDKQAQATLALAKADAAAAMLRQLLTGLVITPEEMALAKAKMAEAELAYKNLKETK